MSRNIAPSDPGNGDYAVLQDQHGSREALGNKECELLGIIAPEPHPLCVPSASSDDDTAFLRGVGSGPGAYYIHHFSHYCRNKLVKRESQGVSDESHLGKTKGNPAGPMSQLINHTNHGVRALF